MPRSYLSSLQRFKLPDSSVVEFDAAIKCADDADEHDDDDDADNDDDVFVRRSGLMAEHARKQGRARLATRSCRIAASSPSSARSSLF